MEVWESVFVSMGMRPLTFLAGPRVFSCLLLFGGHSEHSDLDVAPGYDLTQAGGRKGGREGGKDGEGRCEGKVRVRKEERWKESEVEGE